MMFHAELRKILVHVHECAYNNPRRLPGSILIKMTDEDP